MMTSQAQYDAEKTPVSDWEIQMREQAAEQNKRNAACAVDCGRGQPGYLTPTQVRSMSRREVHDQYALILESMKHWH